MRALLWILLFLTLCAAVALFQARITQGARLERDAMRGARAPAREEPLGFGHVIVGEASGAPLVEPDVRRAPSSPRGTEPSNPVPARGQQNEHVVKHGESLSIICQLHYGTGRPDVVAALARFNRLKGVDAIREGQRLSIPPISALNIPAK